MRVLVGYATKQGSTREVAERIADRIREHGHQVDLHEVTPDDRVEPYEAVVLGSAVYSGAWLAAAGEFTRGNTTELSTRPVWTFTVGRLTGQGWPLRKVTWPDDGRFTDVREAVHPRGHRFFPGVLDPRKPPFFQRLVFRAVGGCYGDYRDWGEIDAWADGIGHDLAAMTSAG